MLLNIYQYDDSTLQQWISQRIQLQNHNKIQKHYNNVVKQFELQQFKIQNVADLCNQLVFDIQDKHIDNMEIKYILYILFQSQKINYQPKQIVKLVTNLYRIFPEQPQFITQLSHRMLQIISFQNSFNFEEKEIILQILRLMFQLPEQYKLEEDIKNILSNIFVSLCDSNNRIIQQKQNLIMMFTGNPLLTYIMVLYKYGQSHRFNINQQFEQIELQDYDFYYGIYYEITQQMTQFYDINKSIFYIDLSNKNIVDNIYIKQYWYKQTLQTFLNERESDIQFSLHQTSTDSHQDFYMSSNMSKSSYQRSRNSLSLSDSYSQQSSKSLQLLRQKKKEEMTQNLINNILQQDQKEKQKLETEIQMIEQDQQDRQQIIHTTKQLNEKFKNMHYQSQQIKSKKQITNPNEQTNAEFYQKLYKGQLGTTQQGFQKIQNEKSQNENKKKKIVTILDLQDKNMSQN